MTESEALATCTGFVSYSELKGYFPFAAVNVLLATGKYEMHQVCCWGYVLRLLTPEQRAVRTSRARQEEHGGALDWLGK